VSPAKQAPRGGIDLGGTKIQTVVVDGRFNVLGQARRQTPTSGGPEKVAEEMAGAMRDALEYAKLHEAGLSGVGVGSPGDVDQKTGTVSRARNLPDWEGSFELGKWLSDALEAPVNVGNDVGVATEAEAKLGAGKKYESLVGIFWGTGVGGGLILDGKHWLGRGGAGEIGHTVVKLDGRKCPCGRRGCLEAYAGRSAMEARARKEHEDGRKTDLFKIMKKHNRDRLTSGIWARALEAEDKLATELIDEAVEALGAGAASAVNLLDVEAVIIGGGIGVRLGDEYAKRIEKEMHKHLFNDDRPPAVEVASLGDLGGAIGAALLSAQSAGAGARRARTTGARSTQQRKG
jgi:glucokinase